MRRRPKFADRYGTIGVVVVTHTQDWLEDCLASIEAQTLSPHRTVVVDNASPAERPASELASGRGVEVVRVTPGVSLAAARNLGITVLDDCDLIVTFDGDDVMKPDYLRTYRHTMRSAHAQVAYGTAELFGTEQGLQFTPSDRDRRPDLRRGNFVPANSMFTRELWTRAGGFDPGQAIFEDWDFWLSCATVGARFVAVEAPLWGYRRHATSMLNAAHQANKDAARSRIWHKHLDYIRGPLQWRRGRRIAQKAWHRVQGVPQ